MAFGTGHHGTTQGCLEALDALGAAGVTANRVADIGCGTAVLAMAAARLWPEAETVLASDIDAVAVEVALANVAANDLTQRVDCVEAAGFDHARLRAAPYDLLFANILKPPLVALAPEVAVMTVTGGHAILSGILVEQAAEIIQVYEAQGLLLQSEKQIGDWSTLTFQRR